MGFDDLGIRYPFTADLSNLGFEQPTPIQEKAIPPLLNGQDVIGIAQTGTGKTAAYALPMLQKLQQMGDRYWGLVVLPTRELTVQALQMLEDLTQESGQSIAGFYGGKGLKHQLPQLEKQPAVLVCTPKRLLEVYQSGYLRMQDLRFLVLDEADRLMDMGFRKQLRRILEVIPVKRQNILLSATFPESVEELSWEFLEFPTKIEISPQGTPAETVEQIAYQVPNLRTKIALLDHLTETEEWQRVLVFVRKKDVANNITKYLERKSKGGARAVHANKGQNTRMNAVQDFREGNIRFLVATDIAARGMDIPEVSHVVNFDAPLNPEDYVHRIGRTGRAGASGKAVSLVAPHDVWHFARIESFIKKKLEYQATPPQVKVFPTPQEEKQAQEREIDRQKRKADPSFKGAFHEKQSGRFRPKGKQGQSKTKGSKSRGKKR